MENHLFRYHWTMYTSLIFSGLRTSKSDWGLLWNDRLHRVLSERRGLINGWLYVSRSRWVTPRISMTCPDNGTMNGHLIVGWIFQFSDGRVRYFCQWLSRNLWSILNLTRTTNQERRFFRNQTEMKIPFQLDLLYTRWCKFVLCWASLVLPTDPGNPPMVRVWPGKIVQFSSTVFQTPDQLLLGWQTQTRTH